MCLLLAMFLSLLDHSSLTTCRVIRNRADESIEEGHVNPGAYAKHNRPVVIGKSRSLPWWPSNLSLTAQALLRNFNVPKKLITAQTPKIFVPHHRPNKRASHRAGSEKEHSNPTIPTTGVRAPRGAHEYDVPQIECPNAEDGMERFACPSPDSLGRYRCIDDHVLCDGFLDCPDGSDEDRHSCMFYKTTKAHLDVLADALLRWARGRYNK
ncbi:uncharacterized protein LOC100904113 [Galendromus occidentalis]|uniref:Uncharacterized protein LOC100904113 n=1 Tax=Galendromus occidentalis TaxID=34638 RepID=A0AAJ6QN02_9ACAR|nr:uncharacterized protein LOC100904113 [Galendromus occidentalis]